MVAYFFCGSVCLFVYKPMFLKVLSVGLFYGLGLKNVLPESVGNFF